MSLKDPNDEYDELVPEGSNFFSKLLNKNKKFLIILVVGILIGIFMQYLFINPLINQAQANTCKECTYSKELLNQENDCLYTLLPDAKNASALCGAQNYIQKQLTIKKDFNEETA